jgi:hypothetical protein
LRKYQLIHALDKFAEKSLISILTTDPFTTKNSPDNGIMTVYFRVQRPVGSTPNSD